MTTLVTGGSGFIGRNLIKALLEEEHDVIAVSRSCVTDFTGSKNFQWISGDLVTGEGLEKIPWETLECVIHLAAAGVKSSKRNWDECIQVNILGTERLLNYIKKWAIKNPKVFLSKTCYEKALPTVSAFKENPYVVTKEASSQLALLWSEDFKGTTIFGTIYHTFGPDDHPLSVLSYAARCFKEGKPAIFSSGTALGDWLYITDAVNGILMAIKQSHHGVQHWDIGSGRVTTIRDLVGRLHLISGRKKEDIVFDTSLDQADITLHQAAQKLPLGFKPTLTLQQGLEQHYRLINLPTARWQ